MKTFPIIILVFIIFACGNQCSGQNWLLRMRDRFNQQNTDNGDPYEILDPNGSPLSRAGSTNKSREKYVITNSDPYSIEVVDARGESKEVVQDDDGIFDLVPYTEKTTFELTLNGMMLIE